MTRESPLNNEIFKPTNFHCTQWEICILDHYRAICLLANICSDFIVSLKFTFKNSALKKFRRIGILHRRKKLCTKLLREDISFLIFKLILLFDLPNKT